jgi:dCTP deaminase
MLLSEIDIAKRLVDPDENKRLVITPIVNAKEQFGPSSFDVHLSTDFHQLENLNRPYIPLREALSAEEEAKYSKKVVLAAETREGSLYLHPGEFVLASTLEYFQFPDDLAGRIEGRSSWGRLGLLVHATAGFVDPGYAGALTFELSNVGRLPIELKPGLRLGQVCFFQMSESSLIPYDKKHRAKYLGAPGVQGSRAHADPEVRRKSKLVRHKRLGTQNIP